MRFGFLPQDFRKLPHPLPFPGASPSLPRSSWNDSNIQRRSGAGRSPHTRRPPHFRPGPASRRNENRSATGACRRICHPLPSYNPPRPSCWHTGGSGCPCRRNADRHSKGSRWLPRPMRWTRHRDNSPPEPHREHCRSASAAPHRYPCHILCKMHRCPCWSRRFRWRSGRPPSNRSARPSGGSP